MSKSNSLRSKFAIGAFLIGIVMAAASAVIAYIGGKAILVDTISNHLASTRNAKRYHVEGYFGIILNHITVYSEFVTIQDAAKQFSSAFRKLKSESLAADQAETLRGYYRDEFLPEFRKHSLKDPDLANLIPQENATAIVQYRYLAANPNPIDSKNQLSDAGDGSEYSRVHSEFHPQIDKMRSRFRYGNIMIFEPESLIMVYSSMKRISLATSFRTGPFADSALAKAVREAAASTDPDHVTFVDFDEYQPEFGLPAAFAVRAIREGDRVIGVIAFQITTSSILRIVSDSNRWETLGLGKSGEILLIGPNGRHRSESRRFLDNPTEFVMKLRSMGADAELMSKLEANHSSVLAVRVQSFMKEQISLEKEGTTISRDYLGEEVLAAYSPMKLPGLNWGIVVKIPTEEAFQPLVKFERNLLITLAGLGGLSVFVAGLAGTALAAPIRKLTTAARAFTNGFYDVRVNIESGDEVQELAETFNRMAKEIDEKTQKLKRKLQVNRRLLENMMPKMLFSKVRDHESSHASESSMATLAFIELEGVEKLYDSMSANKAREVVDKLFASFDEIARKRQIEKISSGGATYLVACGLDKAMFDHTPRMMEFAMEIIDQIVLFNAEHVTMLAASIGIHRGPVARGSVARKSAFADLWIRTISLASDIEAKDNHSAIRVSEEVYDRVINNPKFRFTKDESDTTEIAWTLKLHVDADSGL